MIFVDEYDIPENVTELNSLIHKWDDRKNGPKNFHVYDYKDIRVIYHVETKYDKKEHVYHQMDEILICKGDEVIAKHKPHLDPYVSYDKHILTLSSDGEIWVYDLENNKELVYPQGIVAFYQSTDVNEARYEIKNNKTIPISEDLIFITGDGCPWGCESDDIYFSLILDYNLNVVRYTQECGNDDYDASEDYDPNYVYFIVGSDFVRMPRDEYFDFKLDPDEVEIYVIPTDNTEPHFEHSGKINTILTQYNILKMETYDSLSNAQYWASRDRL